MEKYKIELNCLNENDAELYLKALASKIGSGEGNIKHESKFYSYSVIKESDPNNKIIEHESIIKNDADDFIIDAGEEFNTEINEEGKTVITIMSKFK